MSYIETVVQLPISCRVAISDRLVGSSTERSERRGCGSGGEYGVRVFALSPFGYFWTFSYGNAL